MQILDKSPSSDHLPVCAKFKLDCIMCDSASCDGAKNNSNIPVTNFQWTKATDDHIDKYNRSTRFNLKTIDIPDAIFCNDVDCKLDHHISDIDAYYSSICDALIVASKAHIPSCNFRCLHEYVVPGFNEHVKDLHDTARQYYLVWRDAGKSRNDETHSDMRRSRLQFKYALRLCRANEDMHRADALALSLKDRNSTSFWKDVQKMATSKIPLATKVGGAIGNEQISDMWHHHFSELLNSVHNTDSKSFVSEHIDDMLPKTAFSISAGDVRDILKDAKMGKSAGLDSLAAEYFVYSHSSITVHLSLLFACMLSHGYIPSSFMKTSIIPILKNRNGDTSDKNNYRPIAIVAAMSKLFELCLSKILDEYLCTSENQFGFKKKHATDLCIYTVKSVIKYYNYFSSPVFTCFLDASNAFDRVNH